MDVADMPSLRPHSAPVLSEATSSFSAAAGSPMIYSTVAREDDPHLIALYYCYPPSPLGTTDTFSSKGGTVSSHATFHRELCETLDLRGRVRVSPEGINGVLSGRQSKLVRYESAVREELLRSCCGVHDQKFGGGGGGSGSGGDDDDDGGDDDGVLEFDVKYCHLRTDVPIERQLFEELSVKETREVVSLHEPTADEQRQAAAAKRRKARRRRKEGDMPNEGCGDATNGRFDAAPALVFDDPDSVSGKEKRTMPQGQQRAERGESDGGVDPSLYPPAPHLSPEDWQDRLLSLSSSSTSSSSTDAVLIDARNVYESRVGHFDVPGIPTLLTNTRKCSSLPAALESSMEHLAGKEVFMYCTGGVRCERASAYLTALVESDRWKTGLDKPKGIYQLKGGVQRYLEAYGTPTDRAGSADGDDDGCTIEDVSNRVALDNKLPMPPPSCLYKGKNFVFDPRRTDPIVGPDSPGRCRVCNAPHDDYDNGHAPCEGREARCCRCRVLVLVCNMCRGTVRCWGESKEGKMNDDADASTPRPDLFCGPSGERCIDEGNSVNVEIIGA